MPRSATNRDHETLQFTTPNATLHGIRHTELSPLCTITTGLTLMIGSAFCIALNIVRA